MKTIAAIAVIASFVITANPALAGKKKAKKKASPIAEPVEAPRRLSDAAGFGMAVASPTGDRGMSIEEAQAQDADAVARAESFELSHLGRDSSTPSSEDEIRLQVQPLTEAQVGDVVRGRGGDLEYCWSRVPAAGRDGLSLSLRFTIEPKGTVSKVELLGDAPVKLSVCVKAAAKRWMFPVADTTSLVEYPITLTQR